ncbi:hypothetical protein FS749_006869 [Ceratobasidium sp. UAMH 11750]|nr:hypothetical protein FS749_006869 [Ceratobasidium sp. UAMH 11750]
MTAALDLNKIQRFYAYAGFVHTLYLGSSILPQVLRLAFLGRKDALLPNLRHLFIGASPHSAEWPDNTFTTNDVLELLALFLSPSLQTLSLSCEGLAIDPDELFRRAPNLSDMRLSCGSRLKFPPNTPPCLLFPAEHHPCCLNHSTHIPGVYAQAWPGQWADQMTLALPRWQQLTNLAVNGDFLGTKDALRRISVLPNLVRLLIVAPSSFGWADLPSGDDVFPKLRDVTLNMATYPVARTIFCCPAVSPRVAVLDWKICRLNSSTAIAGCVDVLSQFSHVASNIYSLHIYDVPWNGTHLSFWACNTLYDSLLILSPIRFHTECNMHVFDHNPSSIYTFLSLGSRLTYLSLARLQVPAELLELFAYAYPTLSYLRCVVDIAVLTAEHVDKRLSLWSFNEIQDRDSVDISLVTNFVRRRNPPNMPKEAVLSPSSMADYLQSLWPELVLIEDKPHYEYPEAEEYFRQVAEQLG